MAIVYNQLLKLMKEKGITEYQIRVREKSGRRRYNG